MRFTIGRDGWCFFDGRDEPGSESARFRGNESAALQWLEQFRGDSTAMKAIRDQLSKQPGNRSLGDREVLQTVAAHLAAGRWNVRRERTETRSMSAGSGSAAAIPGAWSGWSHDALDMSAPGIGPAGGAAEAVEFGPAFPLEYRRKFQPASTGRSEVVSQQLFPNDADLKAIAEGQKRASERGAALCEECMKAQAASKR